MSRQCKAIIVGNVDVRLVCDMCDRIEWVTVALESCAEDAEWKAVEASDHWGHQDDLITCSVKCGERVWYDDSDYNRPEDW